MKSKWMLDVSVYMIAPIVLCNIIDTEYLTYSIAGLMAIVAIYSLACKQKEARVNLSGLVFVSLCILLTLLKKEVESDYRVYVYDTYILMLCGLGIVLFTLIRKNIITRIYFDMQRSKGVNHLAIWSNIKKCDLYPQFTNLSYVVSLHLIIVSLVKIYSISTYGNGGYTTTQDLEVLISIIFLICEMYMISIIMSKSKLAKNRKKNKNKSKYQLNNNRVISFNQYKNANK